VCPHNTVKYQSVIDYSEGVAMYLEAKKQRRRIVKELTLEYASPKSSPLGLASDVIYLFSIFFFIFRSGSTTRTLE
jgi:hypothetical protein